MDLNSPQEFSVEIEGAIICKSQLPLLARNSPPSFPTPGSQPPGFPDEKPASSACYQNTPNMKYEGKPWYPPDGSSGNAIWQNHP